LDNLLSLSFGFGLILAVCFLLPFWLLKVRGWELGVPQKAFAENHQFSIRWILGATLLFAILASIHTAFQESTDSDGMPIGLFASPAIRAIAMSTAWLFFAAGTIAIIWSLLAPNNLASRVLRALIVLAPAAFPFAAGVGTTAHLHWLVLIGPALVCVIVSLVCVRQSGLRLVNIERGLREAAVNHSDESLQLD
jgi:hypothetical protein